jgi:lipid II:glycine glycyltransferase (peptidoglycan interpeptide bridge formation enzyme)
MPTREIDPIHDPSWLAFIEKHPEACIFHSPAWLEALRRTYGYQPFVLTTSAAGQELTNGVVFCRISSWFTGARLVSLPFTDHCQPLVNGPQELHCILNSLLDEAKGTRWRCIEIRPTHLDFHGFPCLSVAGTFCFHRLDLRPTLGELYESFHCDCVQRKIRRAEREGLRYEESQSELLLEKFYRLMVLTRRRQSLLPAPLLWFRNLANCLGDQMKIRLASKDNQPVASILTLRYKSTLVYKYGCSDKRFSNLGGTQLLFWKAIQEAKRDGLQELDMGRSDWDNPGLIKFKDRWGAARSTLTYARYGTRSAVLSGVSLNSPILGPILGRLSDQQLARVGAFLYRYFG